MLGELIGEFRGKRAPRRVVSTGGGGFLIEVSFESTGKIFGLDCTEIVTYTSGPRPDGSLFGEGNGIVLAPTGEVATWKGAGVGSVKPDGTVGYRGAIYYSSASPALARLNSVAAVFEFDADAGGNTHSKVWEWK